MKQKIFILIFVQSILQNISAQAVWTNTLIPNEFVLNKALLVESVKNKWPVSLPMEDLDNLIFSERSNFSAELSAKYPTIQSFVAIKNNSKIFIDINRDDCSFFIQQKGKVFFITPKENSKDLFRIMSSNDLGQGSTGQSVFKCGSDEISKDQLLLNNNLLWPRNHSEQVSLKVYRLALAVTAEFALQYGTTKEKVMAALNQHLTKINAIYHQENAIEFRLVPNNDTLIFFDPASDPYTNGKVGTMLSQNPQVLSDYIGLNNFDIGHVFGTNDGGVASLSCVCTANKASGASCSFPPYVGENFYLIPSHEMGHQFSATHIFNLCDNSNESSISGFEPGSGSTIMSYAGASNCGPNYVQNMMDPYFNTFSLQQIKNFSRVGTASLCGTNQSDLNQSPDVKVISPVNTTIPKSTPFELQGIATDDRSRNIVYTWEEQDLGIKSLLGSPQGTAPLFRSFPPSEDSVRILPSLGLLLNNKNSINEILPSISRPLNFRITARDLDPNAGGTNWADASYQVSNTAGPFKITNFYRENILFANDYKLLTWDVAGTNKSPVNCRTVDVYWSDSVVASFNKVIARHVENDGSEYIKIPQNITNAGRIKIKASDNIFFDINDTTLRVVSGLPSSPSVAVYPNSVSVCAGNSQSLKLFSSIASNNDTLIISAVHVPDGMTFRFSKNKIGMQDSVFATLSAIASFPLSESTITIQAINQRTKDTIPVLIIAKVLSGNIRAITPFNGQDQVSTTPVFKWEKIFSDADFIFELSGTADFKKVIDSKNITQVDTGLTIDSTLMQNQIYYWRIKPLNGCTAFEIPINVFHTQALDCKVYSPVDLPKLISATGTPKIFSNINVTDQIILSQISIPALSGTHEFIGDLQFYLHAPNGDSIVLWSKLCNNLSNFNLALSDQAPIELTCPLTDNKSHRPQTSFQNLTKSNSNGVWKLTVFDTNSGSGGSLDNWSIQLCGAVNAPSPNLVTNNVLTVLELTSENITKNILSATDLDSGPDLLKYTLLNTPSLGYFIINKTDTMKAGGSFLQSDINNNKIRYRAKEVRVDTIEKINLVVSDEKNNWSGIKTFNVKVLNDSTVATVNPRPDQSVTIYPNPFSSHLNIQNTSAHHLHGMIYNSSGISMVRVNVKANSILRIDSVFAPGVYFVYLSDPSWGITVKKLIRIE